MNKDDEEILNERIRLSNSIRLSQSRANKYKCPNCGSIAFDGSDCSSCGFDIYSYDPYDK